MARVMGVKEKAGLPLETALILRDKPLEMME
jgi:hypothetical protein